MGVASNFQMHRPHPIAVFALALLTVSLPALAQKHPVTANDVFPPPSGLSESIQWCPAGDRFAFAEGGVLFLVDAATGHQQTVLSLNKLEASAAKPSTPEPADWTNRRVAEQSLQWFADNRRILVLAAGDLFIVDTNRKNFETLLHTPETERDPKLSPDNRFVSFRRGHDLYALEIATKKTTRLTADGTDTLLNGEPDWVYPEELFLNTAHWWSPDSRAVAYLQFNVSREPVFPQVSLLDTHGVVEPERYPKAGDPNAAVRLGVVPVTGGTTKWMDLGAPADQLLARVVWSPNSHEILAESLNRTQNKLDLLLADIRTGTAKAVLHEEDKHWINVVGEPIFLGTGDRFLWTSERSGFRHIYLCGIDGKQTSPLTHGDWEVDHIAAVDEKHERVFFTSTEASPIERQLYSVNFDGTNKQQLSDQPGTHAVSVAPTLAFYLDDYSTAAQPPRSTLHTGDGREVAAFREPNRTAIDNYDLQPVETVNVKTRDGITLYAHLIRPAGYVTGQRYPAVVMIYGGPDVQEVTDTWAGVDFPQALAQQGFLVWQLDNRGSKGRGHAFESVIYRNLGARELADQREGIDYLVAQGLADPQRIGMYGWSYGGFMTLYTATHAPGLLRAAIAGGPVTNWRNYDSIYTERYMGLPEENAAAYKASSPAEAAAQMGDTRLLMVHNIEDDNVHFQNTVQMAAAMEEAGKQFFMVVYPGRTHSVTGAAARQLLNEATKFFSDNLK